MFNEWITGQSLIDLSYLNRIFLPSTLELVYYMHRLSVRIAQLISLYLVLYTIRICILDNGNIDKFNSKRANSDTICTLAWNIHQCLYHHHHHQHHQQHHQHHHHHHHHYHHHQHHHHHHYHHHQHHHHQQHHRVRREVYYSFS